MAIDKPRRVIKPPQRLGYANLIAYALISASEVLDEKPRYYKEVMRSRNKTEWMKAMDDEMKSLHDNHTWISLGCRLNSKTLKLRCEVSQLFQTELYVW
ncbi:hypothetical protein KIW84_014231 [Lathyrus oleraceus]|uniref:Retrovirus-related Pol polyprotein from transposon TNT 1-94 n=1 Tax=Pisum sativum TaxID=3888 RepID=A0A9D5BMM2_PEA|nr:hypothetical protein KIW84_014231 [Pisum sativum]